MNIKLYFICIVLLGTAVYCAKDSRTASGDKGNTESKAWKLAWSDEFNYTGLPDSLKWGYDVGGHGWGNQEKQYYTGNRLENARVENGLLTIEARRDFWNEHEYTSVRLVSRGKGDWTYGRFEIRAKLPAGRGTWPAIWMLPTSGNYGSGGWPDNGEIDIMEHVGYNPGMIHGSTHCQAYYWKNHNQKTGTIKVPDAETEFHNYIMEWYPQEIKIFLDDSLYFTSKNEGTGWQVWPFDKPFHLLLNIAIGGAWGGVQGIDTTIFPQRMDVDYVRVYKPE
jgi:beta-glucanase (GH16 family)